MFLFCCLCEFFVEFILLLSHHKLNSKSRSTTCHANVAFPGEMVVIGDRFIPESVGCWFDALLRPSLSLCHCHCVLAQDTSSAVGGQRSQWSWCITTLSLSDCPREAVATMYLSTISMLMCAQMIEFVHFRVL